MNSDEPSRKPERLAAAYGATSLEGGAGGGYPITHARSTPAATISGGMRLERTKRGRSQTPRPANAIQKAAA
jgi:hypothetical protein